MRGSMSSTDMSKKSKDTWVMWSRIVSYNTGSRNPSFDFVDISAAVPRPLYQSLTSFLHRAFTAGSVTVYGFLSGKALICHTIPNEEKWLNYKCYVCLWLKSHIIRLHFANILLPDQCENLPLQQCKCLANATSLWVVGVLCWLANLI